MATYLLVAHQTVHRSELAQALRHQMEEDPEAEFVLLVPATPSGFLSSPPVVPNRDIARSVARAASQSLSDAGFRIKWTIIGDQSPILAVDAELKDHPSEYAGVILSTFPEGRSRWLDPLLLHTLDELCIPVTYVKHEMTPQQVNGERV